MDIDIETMQAVESINADIYNLNENEIKKNEDLICILNLCFLYTGEIYVVNFLGFPIWDSDNDEREYYEEEDKYEPIESFLRRKVSELIKTIGSLKMENNNSNYDFEDLIL